MTINDTDAASGTSARALLPTLSFAEFCARAARATAPLEAWVTCTIVDKQAVLGEEQLTIVAAGGSSLAQEIQCKFPGVVEVRLDQKYEVEVNHDELVGSTLALCLRANPGDLFQVTDLDPAWIKDEIRAVNRACLRELVQSGQLELQRGLPEPEAVDRICIITDDDDPLGQRAETLLREAGVSVTVELAEFDGGRGRLSLIGALNRVQSRAAVDDTDLVLMIHTGPDRDGIFALNDNHVAELVCDVGVPVVLGARRPPYGSLLHMIAFDAFEHPEEALESVLGLVRRAREDRAKQAHILGWSERISKRMAVRG